MSSDTSGFVTTAGLEEGKTISKADINATRDSWEEADNSISEFNIREEGLDRRSFDTNDTWTDVLNRQSRCFMSGLRDVQHPLADQGWKPIRFGRSGDTKVVGGTSEEFASISFDWDPQLHTYVILRTSFWFKFDVGLLGSAQRDDAGDDNNFEIKRADHDFQFGILVTAPGETIGDSSKNVRTTTQPNGQIFCPVQVGLNRTWSADSTGTFNQIRHKFDRRSAIATTVSMVVGGQSWTTNSAPNLENNLGAIDLRESGLVQARLYWRARKDARETCDISGSETEGQEIKAELGNMQFFAQVFRR